MAITVPTVSPIHARANLERDAKHVYPAAAPITGDDHAAPIDHVLGRSETRVSGEGANLLKNTKGGMITIPSGPKVPGKTPWPALGNVVARNLLFDVARDSGSGGWLPMTRREAMPYDGIVSRSRVFVFRPSAWLAIVPPCAREGWFVCDSPDGRVELVIRRKWK